MYHQLHACKFHYLCLVPCTIVLIEWKKYYLSLIWEEYNPALSLVNFLDFSYCIVEVSLNYPVRVTHTEVELSLNPKSGSDIETEDATHTCTLQENEKAYYSYETFWESRVDLKQVWKWLEKPGKETYLVFLGWLGFGAGVMIQHGLYALPILKAEASRLSCQLAQLWGRRWRGRDGTSKV